MEHRNNFIYVKRKGREYVSTYIEENESIQYLFERLEHANIEGLLNVECMNIDGVLQLYYDISGKKRIEEYYKSEELSINEVNKLFYQISATIRKCKEWLVEEEELCLSTDYVFLNDKEIGLIFLPGQRGDNNLQVEKLLEFFMKKINPAEKDASCLIYRLYRECKLMQFSWQNIWKELECENAFQDEDERIEDFHSDSTKKDVIRKADTSMEDSGESKKTLVVIICTAFLVYFIMICMVTYYVLANEYLKSPITNRWDNIRVLLYSLAVMATAGLTIIKLREYYFANLRALQNNIQDETVVLEDCRNEGSYCLCSNEQQIPIVKFPFFIGTDYERVDGVIDVTGVSKVHGFFDIEGTTLYYTDHNSTNGSKVNEKTAVPYEKVKIQEGDVIRFGKVPFSLIKDIS